MRTGSLSKYRSLPLLSRAQELVGTFGPSGKALFFLCAALIVGSSLFIAKKATDRFLVVVPAPGGSLREGVVGSPRFVNPLLAISDADRDLTTLVYSGLMRATPDGELVHDLAEYHEVSEDGTVYTFTLKEGLLFHDGTPVTADDVVYTVMKAQDPSLKSPKRANWDGVLVEKIDERTVRFTLREAYVPFLENTTLGILPRHLWKGVSSDEFPFSSLNTHAVGSGPFMIRTIDRSSSGIPGSYVLVRFDDFALGAPYLSRLAFFFYDNERDLLQALEAGAIEAGNSISPSLLASLSPEQVRRAPLNRVFGIFFNQNQNEVLRDVLVRRALHEAIDRDALVTTVLKGYATPVSAPVPPGVLQGLGEAGTVAGTSTDPALLSRTLLESKGWVFSEAEQALTLTDAKKKSTKVLSLTLTTGNVPELRAAAEFVREAWERMGAKVEVKIFEQGDLTQNVIRPRKYDALLFGEIVGRELDLYAFWHSSQRNDPGLNIALYANSTADKLLETMRREHDVEARLSAYKKFESELERDIPAIFLYTPDFVYFFPDRVKGLSLGSIATPAERFLGVHTWHTDVERVWPFFAD